MPYKNIKAVLLDATKYPAAIEAKLPAGAPVISTMLLNAANQIPVVPDFPIEIPDMPAPPELPAMPTPPAGAGLRQYITGAEVTRAPSARPAATNLRSAESRLVFE